MSEDIDFEIDPAELDTTLTIEDIHKKLDGYKKELTTGKKGKKGAKKKAETGVDTLKRKYPDLTLEADVFTQKTFMNNYWCSFQNGHHLHNNNGYSQELTEEVLRAFKSEISNDKAANKDLFRLSGFLKDLLLSRTTVFDSLLNTAEGLLQEYQESPGNHLEILLNSLHFSISDEDEKEAENHKNLYKKMVRKWFLNAAASFYGTGEFRECYQELPTTDPAANEFFLLLQGFQGMGKTRFINALLKPFNATFSNFNTHNVNCYENNFALATHAFILLDEISFLSEKAMAEIKALLSTTELKERKKYEAMHTRIIKRCSFIGSSNAAALINDTTGSRRYLVIPVRKFDHFLTFEKEEFQKLVRLAWGQAIAENRADPTARFFDHEEQMDVETSNEAFTLHGMLEETVKTCLVPYSKRLTEETKIVYFSNFAEILSHFYSLAGVHLPSSSGQQRALLAEIRAILGQRRFVEYKKRKAIRNSKTNKVMSKYELHFYPEMSTKDIHGLEERYQERIEKFKKEMVSFLSQSITKQFKNKQEIILYALNSSKNPLIKEEEKRCKEIVKGLLVDKMKRSSQNIDGKPLNYWVIEQ